MVFDAFMLDVHAIVICRVYFREDEGVLSPPPPWQLAFPIFSMGLPPLRIWIYPLLSEILK